MSKIQSLESSRRNNFGFDLTSSRIGIKVGEPNPNQFHCLASKLDKFLHITLLFSVQSHWQCVMARRLTLVYIDLQFFIDGLSTQIPFDNGLRFFI